MSSNVVKRLKMKKLRKKRRKKLILFSFILIVSTLSIGLLLRDKDVNVKAEYLTNNIEQNNKENVNNKELDDNISYETEIKEEKDNSGYLELEEDENADDVSKVLPETMYKWDFYREDNRKVAYLTFDDGPSSKSTNKILDILERNNIKATFFVLGSSIDSNNNAKETLKRIAR